jgi:hypothetical protein
MGDWLLLGGLLLLGLAVVLLLVVSILRYNQLSMARGLAAESGRQLSAAIRERRDLLPLFLTVVDQAGVSVAELRASQAGADEAELSRAIERAHTRVLTGGADAWRVDDLYSQLVRYEIRIASAMRYRQHNVDAYRAMRARPSAGPVRWLFRPCPAASVTQSQDVQGPVGLLEAPRAPEEGERHV